MAGVLHIRRTALQKASQNFSAMDHELGQILQYVTSEGDDLFSRFKGDSANAWHGKFQDVLIPRTKNCQLAFRTASELCKQLDSTAQGGVDNIRQFFKRVAQ